MLPDSAVNWHVKWSRTPLTDRRMDRAHEIMGTIHDNPDVEFARRRDDYRAAVDPERFCT